MHERFGIPVGLDNDANAAAIGEWRAGAGRGVDDLVMLTLGTGVGGGVISGGKPFRGRNGEGAELGHVVIVHDGPAVPGRVHRPRAPGGVRERQRGDRGRARGVRPVGRRAPAHAARERGRRQAKELLEEVAGYLGSGIGSFVNVFAPQLVVLGGGFGVAAFDYLRGPAEEVARREALEPMRSSVRLAKAELGTAAGLIGAAFVAFEALDSG